MFKIYDGRKEFFQWDLDRKLIIEDESITEVHFCNRTDECSLVCEVYEENGQRLVNVPNILLQTDWRIRVYAYDSKYTKHYALYNVVARSKPADYVYTETEIKSYAALEERVAELEENGIPQEVIAGAVENYLTENPIEAGATAEQAKQIEDNTAAIKELQEKEVDLTGYATEEYVNSAIGAIDIPEVDLTGYATEQYVDDAVAAIDLPTGGGGEWKLLYETTIEKEIMKASFTFDDKYAEYDCTLYITPNTNEGQTSRTYLWCEIGNKNGGYLAQFYQDKGFPANNDSSGYAKWQIKHLENTGITANLICHGHTNNATMIFNNFASPIIGEIKAISFRQQSGSIPVGTKIIIYGRY